MMGRAAVAVTWTVICLIASGIASMVLNLGDCAPEVVNCHPRGPLNIALFIIFAAWVLLLIGMIRSWRKNVQ